MTCFHPIKGWRSKELNSNGKRGIVFNPSQGYADLPITVPCGQCSGCRLERSRQWAIRCVHEASLHSENCFVTLTYDDTHLPTDGSLDIRHFQLFMKRLRKKYSGRTIRFFHCGEYGENLGRPHYHACIFGLDFEDKKLWRRSRENNLYRSEILEQLWPMGFSLIGEVTFESAAYCARYIMKKMNGELAQDHYRRVDPETGEIFDLTPEYTTMSRRPGLASNWLKKFSSDVYPGDFVVINRKKVKPPKFYDRQYEITNEQQFRLLRAGRKLASKKHAHDQTPERRRVREKCHEARIKRLSRGMSDEG